MESLAKNYKIAVMSSAPITIGFKVAGITESHVVEQSEEAEPKIKELLARNDIGIIVITSKVVNMVSDRKMLRTIENSIMPLFIRIPEYNEELVADDALRQLIIRVIGVDISNKV